MMNAVGATPLIEQWSEAFRAVPQSAGPDWLQELRSEAARQFGVSGLPNRKTETWKYTPLRLLEQQAPSIEAAASASPANDDLPQTVVSASSGMVDILNGRLIGDLPETPPGLTLTPMADGFEAFGATLQRLLPAAELAGPANAFTALNTAFLDQGLIVHVAENTDGGSLLLRWSRLAETSARLDNFRLVVLLEAGAKFELIEQFESAPDSRGVLNVVTQVELAAGAQLGHVRVQRESEEATLLTKTTVGQAADSRYRYFGFDLGGGLVRHELGALLAGEGADTDINGAFVLDRKRHVDNHISVDHAATGCSSSQFFRGVLGGASRGVFNGRALIRPGADGSSVRQSNANLLLSPLAEMDTKPELEIYADEVEASHGATVGQLDETAVFYMRTRGLSEDESRRILTAAFCHAVTERLEDRDFAERIAGMFDAAMPGGLDSAGER
ncbi:MAG: Fe-S cluster assembly protein SufD [Xanthomonadales bacterium]|nr:Fe-S cluster assembly protein SufD [Gammaproteobacteria bacterium]NND56717.1 Fe-S cluster assembly protein SufD [Xanthomonadales bacterium]NNK52702.1 Fe-S cluster assembly protein SufD [Xanthomonadales bacterium]